MPGTVAPNIVDYLTLAVATLGSLGGIATTVWVTRRGDRERFDLHVDWAWEPNAEDPEFPLLHIHNKSDAAILVREIRYAIGIFRRKPKFGTALYWEDPMDLDFPATVAAGQIRRFRLSEVSAKQRFNQIGALRRAFGLVRRSSLWVEVLTAGGSVKYVGAENALPWAERPAWTKLKDDENA